MSRCTALLLVSLVSATALAQEVPFTGIVIDDKVEVRAGGGNTFYVVGTLQRGALVQVDEVLFGWLKIVPPAAVHSVVGRAFVNRQGAGNEGVINQDRVDVLAGNVNPSDNPYKRQVFLTVGDKVTILGEAGDFYKIAPPKGAFVFLPPGSVRRATAAEIASGVETRPAAEPKPVDAAPTPTPVPAGTPDPAPVASTAPLATVPGGDVTTVIVEAPVAEPKPDPTVTAVQTPTATEPPAPAPATPTAAFVELESRFEAASQLPVEQQPVAELLAAYEALRASETLQPTERIVAAARVRQLNRASEIQRALGEVAAVRERIATQKTQIEQTAADRAARPNYDAVGQLLVSPVFTGEKLPRLYRLADPGSFRTICYVQLPPSVDLQKVLGRMVGVVGDTRNDPAVTLRVIEAARVDVLQADAGVVDPNR